MYPSVLSSLTDPQATDRLNSPSHSGVERAQNSAIEQLEAVVGIQNSSVVGSIQYKLTNSASDGGGHVQSANKGGTGQTSYTKGDLLVAQSSSVLSKQSIGSDGYVLTADSTQSTGIKWNAPVDANYIVGGQSPVFVKTYFNAHLLFTLYTGATSGALTTDYTNWVRTSSTDITILPPGMFASFAGTGNHTLYLPDSMYGSGASVITFGDSNIVSLDFWAKTITVTNDIFWGLASGTGEFDDAYNAVVRRVGFAVRGSTGDLYAVTGNNTTGTQTQITGITLTANNNYRIIVDLGTDIATFYVNGILKATINTTVPTAQPILIGFGRAGTTSFVVTAPYLSLEMNP